MSFENHIFISYASIDNQSDDEDQEGWVSLFEIKLQNVLTELLGKKAKIWRDDDIGGSDLYDKKIINNFENSALLLSVISPGYIESDWCKREIEEFCEFADKSSGAIIGGVDKGEISRVFTIVKLPVDREAYKGILPEVIRKMSPEEFFEIDDNTPLTFGKKYGKKSEQKLNKKITTLAHKISMALKNIPAQQGSEQQVEAATDNASGRVVYLAETSNDLKDYREEIKTDLLSCGYRVLPGSKILLDDEQAYRKEVAEMLARSDLSVHLVGSKYGAVPDGESGASIVVIQNQLAVEQSKQSALRRIIWLKHGTSSSNSQQQQFIESIQKDTDQNFSAELINGDIEELKSEIHEYLDKEQELEPEGTATDNVIYLALTQEDLTASIPLCKYLKSKAYEIAMPAFEGDAGVVRATNQANMARCQGAIVFYGAGSDGWRKSVEVELSKSHTLRGGHTKLPVCICLYSPGSTDKQFLVDMDEDNLVNCLEELKESSMDEMLNKLNLSAGSVGS